MVIATYARSGATVGLGVQKPSDWVSEISGMRSVGLAALSGLGEPLGALPAGEVLGFALPPSIRGALAAGAMIVLAEIELIPEAFSHSLCKGGGNGASGRDRSCPGPAWRARVAGLDPRLPPRPRFAGRSNVPFSTGHTLQAE